jgi:hypothetical protein
MIFWLVFPSVCLSVALVFAAGRDAHEGLETGPMS